jgi:hypothetical protein
MTNPSPRPVVPAAPDSPGQPGDGIGLLPDFLAGERGRDRPKPRSHALSSGRALEMLTRLPIHAAPVPWLHVQPRLPDGTLRVLDRPTGRQLIIYTPQYTSQFRAGHRAYRWYVRPAAHVGCEPESPSFATARSAIDAVATGRWNLASLMSLRAGLSLRVVWTTAGKSRSNTGPSINSRVNHEISR